MHWRCEKSEFRRILRAMGCPCGKQLVRELFRKYNISRSGRMTWIEFSRAFIQVDGTTLNPIHSSQALALANAKPTRRCICAFIMETCPSVNLVHSATIYPTVQAREKQNVTRMLNALGALGFQQTVEAPPSVGRNLMPLISMLAVFECSMYV